MAAGGSSYDGPDGWDFMTEIEADLDVLIVGAGAAGISAGRRLRECGRRIVILEARDRIGGRAWTQIAQGLWPIDLGCGWLHSADKNKLVAEAERLGLTIDRSAPSWRKRAATQNFSADDQADFTAAQDRFYERLQAATQFGLDRPASESLDPGGRWNALTDAISTYVNGVDLSGLSAIDFDAYEDSGVNWRVKQGYGAFFESWARDLPIILNCPVRHIDHAGARIRIETDQGLFCGDAAIVAVPTTILAQDGLRLSPALPDQRQAACDLPLGVDEKVFLALENAEEFPPDTRVFGATDRVDAGAYSLRAMGMPTVECFFGGDLARALVSEGAEAFAAYAVDEITQALGGRMRRRLKPLAASAWSRDPWTLGAYSHARIGKANARATLAAPVNERLIFAGEACSPHYFSTAHGAAESGRRAADFLETGVWSA
jgi:monoamine oxidase